MAQHKKTSEEPAGEMFVWDWKAQPPLKDIIKFARENPNLQPYEVDDQGDSFLLLFARDRKEAVRYCKFCEIEFFSIRKWKDED